MQLDVAAYGWEGALWSPCYPDDLPDEWRLDYYANQYTSIIVPRPQWQGQQADELALWLEETPEGFRFFWEVSEPQDAQRLLQLYERCEGGRRPGGWLLLPRAELEPAQLEALAGLAPVSHCREAGHCSAGPLTLMPVSPQEPLRSVRERIDRLAGQEGGELLLVVMPAPQAAATLQQLHTLGLLYAG